VVGVRLTGIERNALLYRVRSDLRAADRLMQAGCFAKMRALVGMIRLRLSIISET
jgi:hypothetical protein